MPEPSRPRDLIRWMRAWCERPEMWLVALPDRQAVNVDVLFALITGYEIALQQLGRPEHAAFREFVHARRPDLRRSSDWYGGALLTLNGDGDHQRVIRQIAEWVDELEQSRAR